MEDEEIAVPIILLGSSGVGKTCLVNRFVTDTFEDVGQTVGLSYIPKDVNINGKSIQLQIYDTAGQEKFQGSITDSFYRKARVAIICFSGFVDDTVEKVTSDVQKYITRLFDINPTCKAILAATKCDLCTNDEQIEDFMNGFNYDNIIGRFLTSAKNGYQVNDVFEKAASVFQNIKTLQNKQETIDISKPDNQQGDKKECC